MTNLRNAKYGRRNFVIRCVEDEQIKDQKGETISKRLYRIWAAPFPMEVVKSKVEEKDQKGQRKA